MRVSLPPAANLTALIIPPRARSRFRYDGFALAPLLPVLQQAIDGYRRGSDIMVSNLVIIDNSNTQEAFSDAGIQQTVGKIIVTPRTLNFPELHNFMADTAIGMDLEFFFWAHADNYVMPMSPGRDLGKDVLRCMRRKIDHKPDWGMMLFAYDHLAVFRTQTIVQVSSLRFVLELSHVRREQSMCDRESCADSKQLSMRGWDTTISLPPRSAATLLPVACMRCFT